MSHFLFANDTLIFYDANQEQLEYPSWIFMWFEARLGLKINLEKSELVSITKLLMWRKLLRYWGAW